MKKLLFIIFLTSSYAFAANTSPANNPSTTTPPLVSSANIPVSTPLKGTDIKPKVIDSKGVDSRPVNAKTVDLKGMDPAAFDIDPPVKDTKQWRSSTIHKVMDLCIKLGSSIEKCACTTDFGRSKYSETKYLKLRAELINIVLKGKDINNATPELRSLLNDTYKACSNS